MLCIGVYLVWLTSTLRFARLTKRACTWVRNHGPHVAEQQHDEQKVNCGGQQHASGTGGRWRYKKKSCKSVQFFIHAQQTRCALIR